MSMTLALVEAITKAAEFLFGATVEAAGNIKAVRRDRKDRAAVYLSGLAQIIEDTSASLRQGIYPHGKCEELLYATEKMTETVGDVLGDQVSRCKSMLRTATGVKSLYLPLQQISNSADRDHNFAELDKAAGLFRAVAAYIRMSP